MCSFFLFVCLEPNAVKGYLDENNFRHCYGSFFESVVLKVTYLQLCSKFLLNNYEAHWQQQFERQTTLEDFKDMNQLTC